MEKEKREIGVFNHQGMRFSEIIPISPKLELESVLKGKTEPESLILYLDADNPNSDGSKRPRLVVSMSPDGSVESIALLKAGGDVIMSGKA